MDEWLGNNHYAFWLRNNLYIQGTQIGIDLNSLAIARYNNSLSFLSHENIANADTHYVQTKFKGFDGLNNRIYMTSSSFKGSFGEYVNAFYETRINISLHCLDTLLNIKWHKKYGEDSVKYNAQNIIATSDGGCLLAATKYDYSLPEQQLSTYLLKVDSLGNYTPNSIEKEELEEKSVNVYPNPGNNRLNIQLNETSVNTHFALNNLMGRLLLAKEVSELQTSINTQRLPKGVYLYSVHSKNQVVGYGKWVKE